MSNNTNTLVEKLWTKVGASGTAFKAAALKKFKRSVSAWFILDIAQQVEKGSLDREDALLRLKNCPSTNDAKALTLLDVAVEFLRDEPKIDMKALKAHEESKGRRVENGKPLFVDPGAAEGSAMDKPVSGDSKAEQSLKDKIAETRSIKFHYVMDARHATQIYANMRDGAVMSFVGPPGCGKTSLAMHLAAKKDHQRPVYRVQMNENSTDQTLLGCRTITRESVPTGDWAKFLAATQRMEEAIAAKDQEAIEAANKALKESGFEISGGKVLPPTEEYVEVPKMTWQDGPVVQAMQVGVDRETGEVIEGARAAVLIIDEADAAPPGVMMALQGLMERPDANSDHRRTLILAEDGGRVIRAHPDFCIILTGNTYGYGDMTGKYARNVQDSSNLNRVDATFTFDFPDIEKVFKDAALPDFNRKMKKFFMLVQEAISKGNLQIDFGLRRLKALVRQLHLTGDFRESLKVTCLNPLGPETSADYQTVKGFADQAWEPDYQYRH